MKYKGYEALVSFDNQDEVFHGEIIDIRDVITFQGTNVDELKKAFMESVEDYLAFCKKLNEEPDKPFSSQFVVRISPELHKRIWANAKREGKSLNSWVEQKLSS